MPDLLYIGLDTLHLTVFSPVLPDIIAKLADLKALAADSSKGFQLADFGLGEVAVDARGLRHYSYCFRNSMCLCFISAGQSPHFPQIKLCYGSLVCNTLFKLVYTGFIMPELLNIIFWQFSLCRASHYSQIVIWICWEILNFPCGESVCLKRRPEKMVRHLPQCPVSHLPQRSFLALVYSLIVIKTNTDWIC